MEAPGARLIILAPSHFCERARWALDHAGLPYREECWAPGLHMPLATRLAKRTSLPILQTGATVIQGSDRILDWIGITGGDASIEQRFEQVIAPLVRQYLYAATLADPRSRIRNALLHGVPPAQAWTCRLLWPLIRRRMAAAMAAHPERLPHLEQRLEGELAWFDGVIRTRRHLVGDRLGRADITAASLLAPLLRGPAITPLYERVRLPQGIEQALAHWNQAPSLRWARRLYQLHRGYSPATRSR